MNKIKLIKEIQEKGQSLKNVVKGAQKVALPATFGVLTTVAAFVPLLFVGTMFGSFFEAIGWVVILNLLLREEMMMILKPFPSRRSAPGGS
mgnify:CR=1 FL=1